MYSVLELQFAGGESCDPLPVLPPNRKTDLGEGECRVFMDILISSKVNALREVRSAGGEQ
jgi:hypothetical protein